MLTDQPEAGEPVRHQSIGVRLSNFISHWIDRLQPSSELVLMVTALIVGIGAGLGAVVFRYLINGVGWIGYTWFPQISHNWGKSYVIIVPAIGGLLVGPLVYFFAREAKGHGVSVDFLVIHVLHKGETILPHGDTSLQPDDIVTFLVKESDIDRLEAFWKDLQKQES
jgi:hypothetical protein